MHRPDFLTALACAFCTAAGAQPAPIPTQPELPYRSTLGQYRPFKDEMPQDWKQANDNVGRIGGWKAYAREASGETPAPASNPAPKQAPPEPHRQQHQQEHRHDRPAKERP